MRQEKTNMISLSIKEVKIFQNIKFKDNKFLVRFIGKQCLTKIQIEINKISLSFSVIVYEIIFSIIYIEIVNNTKNSEE